jgi:hypothetical protein
MPVVLNVERVNVLAQVRRQVAAQGDRAGQAEIEVGQIVSWCVGGGGAAALRAVGLLNWPE